MLVFLVSFFSIPWQVSVNQDLQPGNMILTEVILKITNNYIKYIYLLYSTVLSLLLRFKQIVLITLYDAAVIIVKFFILCPASYSISQKKSTR